MPFRAILILSAVCLAACGPDTGPGRQKVKESLKDPESAQFRNEVAGKPTGLFCGEVNAKNSMGGYGGFKRYIVMPDFVAFDGDETSILLQDKDPAKTAARNEKVKKELAEMYESSGRRLSSDESLEVMLRAIFQEAWEASCVQ